MTTEFNGGLQYIPQIAVQYIYLDFYRELISSADNSSDGSSEKQNFNLNHECIADIVSELNKKFIGENVIFVTELPVDTDFSTIHIGNPVAPALNIPALTEQDEKLWNDIKQSLNTLLVEKQTVQATAFRESLNLLNINLTVTAEPDNFTVSETDNFSVGKSDLGYLQTSLSDGSYYIGTVFDAEKGTRRGDADLCWAATVSNMLAYTGWGYVNGCETEDDIFDIFRGYFSNGGQIKEGINWFFSGRYDGVRNGGGGYYTTVNVAEYKYDLYNYNDSAASKYFASDLKAFLEDGFACGAAFGWFPYEGSPSLYRNGGHAVTVWGYTYDASYTVSDPRYLTGLIISDSDNDKVYSDPRRAPDTKNVISLKWNTYYEAYYTTDYKSGNYVGKLEGFTFLEPCGQSRGAADLTFAVDSYWGRNYSISLSSDSFSESIPGLTSSDNIYVAVNTINNGYTDAETFYISWELYSNGNVISTKYNTVSELANSESQGYYVNLGKLAVGSYSLKVTLDSSDTIAESNENNNVLNINFYIDYGANYISDGESLEGEKLQNGTWYLRTGAVAANNQMDENAVIVASSGAVVSRNTLLEVEKSSAAIIHVESGGLAVSNTIYEGREEIYGSASGTQLYGVDPYVSSYQIVHSGGSAFSTVISGIFDLPYGHTWGAFQKIESGGYARETVIYNGCSQVVSGVAEKTRLSGGGLDVYAGGVAYSVDAEEGYIYVKSDGVINDVELDSGHLVISSGAVAYNATLNGGQIRVFSEGILNNAQINGGSVKIDPGAVIRNTVFESGTLYLSYDSDAPYLYDVTIKNDALLSTNGSLCIGGTLQLSGILEIDYIQDIVVTGVVNNDLINYTPRINIMLNDREAGDAAAIRWKGYDPYYTSSIPALENRFSNVAFSITLDENQKIGDYILMEGVSGITDSFTVYNYDGTVVGILSGKNQLKMGDFTYSLNCYGTNLHLQIRNPNQIASDAVKIYSKGKLFESGNFIKGSVLGTDAWLYNAPVSSMTISSGGTAASCFIGYSATQFIFDGGVASSTTIGYRGEQYIFSGGKSYDAALTSYCSQNISSGGVAYNTVLQEIATQTIFDGGIAYNTILDGGGVDVMSGGILSGAVVSACGIVVSAGGWAEDVTVCNPNANHEQDYVYMNIYGSASNLRIKSGGDGWLAASSFGRDITVEYGGLLNLHSEAALSGDINLAGSVDLALFDSRDYIDCQNANINFDLTDRSTDDSSILYGDEDDDFCYDQFAALSGANFNIIVDNDMACGKYKLASIVHSLSDTLTIQDENGRILGDVSLNNVLETTFSSSVIPQALYQYSLQLDGSVLSLNVSARTDTLPPTVPTEITAVYDAGAISIVWGDSADENGVAYYEVRYARKTAAGSVDWSKAEIRSSRETDIRISNLAPAEYFCQIRAFDNAGNSSEWSVAQSFTVESFKVGNLQGSSSGLSWDALPGDGGYIVEYFTGNLQNVVVLETLGTEIDFLSLPAGNFQWQVRAKDGSETTAGKTIVSTPGTAGPQELFSDIDGNTDVFFARTAGSWNGGYAAQHQGTFYNWSGTGEQITLKGKNKIADIFSGSNDANVLLLTDDGCGDALFTDDQFTALGEKIRLNQIDEIRAGLGNDIIDLTSKKFAYKSNNMTIYGGGGDDTIWSSRGSNILYGDAGNDRLVGASENDMIIGGSGNDSMHGGGGHDIFCFGENWGNDIVEQLGEGKVTLWFEKGSESNWNAATRIYSDGNNTVSVYGVSCVELEFGADDILPAGAFLDAASEKIFEDKDKGMLA